MRRLTIIAAISLLVTPAMAQDNIEGPWGTPNGDLAATQRPNMKLDFDGWMNGIERAWDFDTVANGLNRTAFQTGQIVFDADGNVYWVAIAANLASVDPNGKLRWKTPLTLGSSGATPGFSPVVGGDAVYCLSNANPGLRVGAYSKSDGGKKWETDITADGFCNGSGLTPILYNGKLYVVTAGAGCGVGVAQVDAASGKQDWFTRIFDGTTAASDGVLTFVADRFGEGVHGLFFNLDDGVPNWDTGERTNDVFGVEVRGDGATLRWVANGGNRSRSHLVYSAATDLLYAHTWRDNEIVKGKGGTSFTIYDPNDGAVLDTVRSGNYGFSDAGMLGLDNSSVIVGDTQGQWIVHVDSDGDGLLDEIRVYKSTNTWYSEPRCFSQLFNVGDQPVVLTGTSSNTDVDGSRTARVVFLDLSKAVVPNVEDGALYVDDLEVYSGTGYDDAIGRGTVYAENFSAYNEGDAVGSLPGWTDDSSGTPLPAPAIVHADDTQGHALAFDAFGNNFGNQAAASVDLASPVPDFDGGDSYVVIRWKQWRADLTDNVSIGSDSQGGAFEWDQTKSCFTAGPNFSQEAPLTAGAWQQIELRYDYNQDTLDLYVDGELADGFPDQLTSVLDPMSALTFAMDPTPPATNDGVPFTDPLVQYDTTRGGNLGAPHQRGGPLLGPDGKIYYFETDTRKLVALKHAAPAFARGDSNCDGSVDFNDIDCFVAALIAPDQWSVCGHGDGCDFTVVNDIDESGSVNFEDIDGFVECLINGGC